MSGGGISAALAVSFPHTPWAAASTVTTKSRPGSPVAWTRLSTSSHDARHHPTPPPTSGHDHHQPARSPAPRPPPSPSGWILLPHVFELGPLEEGCVLSVSGACVLGCGWGLGLFPGGGACRPALQWPKQMLMIFREAPVISGPSPPSSQ